MEYNVHLIIPDSHAKPNQSLERFDLVGKFAYHLRPTHVICLGDLFDFSSLSSYDKGKGSFEGRRVKKDIDAGVEAQDRIWREYRRNKKRLPRRYFLVGNHEYRLWRFLDQEPSLNGMVEPSQLALKDYWDETIYYRGATPDRTQIDGIMYSHFFPSGVLGRPITMPDCGRKLVQKLHMSATCGDTHYLDYYTEVGANGQRFMGLNAGCLIEEDEAYAGTSNDLWWRGVIVKTIISPGVYDLQLISLDRLKRMYI